MRPTPEIDQTKLPMVTVHRLTESQTLRLHELDAWLASRESYCTHNDPLMTCQICRDSLAVCDAVSACGAAILMPRN